MTMRKKPSWKTYTFWVLLAEGAGALSGWLTREGVEVYKAQTAKPPLTPPAPVFPIVWTGLFALMGIGAARVWAAPRSSRRSRALLWFGAQLGVNFAWNLLFFNARAFGAALLLLGVLLALILGMIRAFARVDRAAAWLQVPYLLWTAFAGYLCWGVWRLN